MILRNPLTDPDSLMVDIIDYIDIALTVIFLIEFLIKVIAKGFFLNGEESYLRNPWNVLDLIIVLSSVKFY